jgi:hypothetical protein
MAVQNGAMNGQITRRLDQAKDALARRCLASDATRQRMLNLAVGEAAAVAWQTGFPHLVFPTLADEKIEAVNRWTRKQERIRAQGLV